MEGETAEILDKENDACYINLRNYVQGIRAKRVCGLLSANRFSQSVS